MNILLLHLSILPYGASPDADLQERERVAQASWDQHTGLKLNEIPEIRMRDYELTPEDFDRLGPDGLPYVRDVFDLGCLQYRTDVVAYINADCGLTTKAPERIAAGVKHGGGVTVSPRRCFKPDPGKTYESVLEHPADGGFDLMAFTPDWWRAHRLAMPNMVIGREAWDTVFRELAEESADELSVVPGDFCMTPEQWSRSLAYTDDVIYHAPHLSPWQRERTRSESQLYNRSLAKAFFAHRGMRRILQAFEEQEKQP